MKVYFLSFFFGFSFFVVFMLGVGFGYSSRFAPGAFAPASRPAPELKCTCVTCLPDLFCMKCGHKSRDCPKLAWYFRKGTNAVNAVSSPVK